MYRYMVKYAYAYTYTYTYTYIYDTWIIDTPGRELVPLYTLREMKESQSVYIASRIEK